MFHADTASGPCVLNSGFCTTVDVAAQIAAPTISRAPVSRVRPSPSPSAIRPIPVNEIPVPIQAIKPKRSPSISIANTAVMIGLTLMMKLAAPAETVSSPTLRKIVYAATNTAPP